jgi:Domain of unknown function (DUF4262)
MEEEIAKVVRRHGWFAACVSDRPPFLYTIGLMQTLNHPELIILGQDSDRTHPLISGIIQYIRAGQSFANPGVCSLHLNGEHRLGFRRVHPTQHPRYLGFAMGYYRHIGRFGELQAIQVFWPDGRGKFPFEVGCDLAAHELQPRLDIEMTPREIRQFERRWE